MELGKIVHILEEGSDSRYELVQILKEHIKYYQDKKGLHVDIQYSSLGRSHTVTYSALVICRELIK